MPQLPSGKHFALDTSPLWQVIDDAYEGRFVHAVMAIERPEDMFEHVAILYLRPRAPDTAPWQISGNSDHPPDDLEPYPSGFNLVTIKGECAQWSKEDQRAFVEFLNSPKTDAYFSDTLDTVRACQQDLLGQPSSLPGLIATWWKHGCHPLQEPLDEPPIAMPQDFPTFFDSLAALSKLSKASECDPAFYERHQQAFDMAGGFIGCLGSRHPNLALIFVFTGAPLADTAIALEQFLSSTSIPELNLEWVDKQMTIVMQQFVPIVRDPAFPAFLQECRWPIEGAFE